MTPSEPAQTPPPLEMSQSSVRESTGEHGDGQLPTQGVPTPGLVRPQGQFLWDCEHGEILLALLKQK